MSCFNKFISENKVIVVLWADSPAGPTRRALSPPSGYLVIVLFISQSSLIANKRFDHDVIYNVLDRSGHLFGFIENASSGNVKKYNYYL